MSPPCIECGGKLERRSTERATKVGRYTVKDADVRLLVCRACGLENVSLQEGESIDRRAALAALRHAPVVDGALVRFARRSVGLTQRDLAELLGVDHATVSRWENDRMPIAQPYPLALRAIVGDIDALGGDTARYLARVRSPAPARPPRVIKGTAERIGTAPARKLPRGAG